MYFSDKTLYRGLRARNYRIYSNNSPSSNNSPPRIMPYFWRFWKNNTPSSNNSPPRIMPHPKRYGGKQNYKNAQKIRMKLPKTTRSQKSRSNFVVDATRILWSYSVYIQLTSFKTWNINFYWISFFQIFDIQLFFCIIFFQNPLKIIPHLE